VHVRPAGGRRPRGAGRGVRGPRLTGRVPLDGIVLAGGSGRRLGRPKATVELAGTTLVERAVAILRRQCPRGVVVPRVDVDWPAARSACTRGSTASTGTSWPPTTSC